MNRAYEKVSEGEVKVREKGKWLHAMGQVIPGLSGKVPAELNAWGEEKVIPGSVFQHWLPYKWSKESTDAVELGLEKLKVYPALPTQYGKRNGVDIKLSEDIYSKLCVAYGHEAKKWLDTKFADPVWQEVLLGNEMQHNRLRAKIDAKLTQIRNRHKKRAIIEYLRKK